MTFTDTTSGRKDLPHALKSTHTSVKTSVDTRDAVRKLCMYEGGAQNKTVKRKCPLCRTKEEWTAKPTEGQSTPKYEENAFYVHRTSVAGFPSYGLLKIKESM